MSLIKYIDIIKCKLRAILSNIIKSRFANNQNFNNLTYFLTNIITVIKSLMKFVGLSIIANFF